MYALFRANTENDLEEDQETESPRQEVPTSSPTAATDGSPEKPNTKDDSPSLAAPTSETPSSSSPVRVMIWKEAHHETCVQNHSLTASIEQVLSNHHHDTPLPCSDDVLLWDDPKMKETMIELTQKALNLSVPQPSPSLASRVYSTAKTAAVAVLTSPLKLFIASDEIDDIPEDWEFDPNDNALSSSKPIVSVDIKVQIVDVERTIDCLQVLISAVRRCPPCILSLDDDKAMRDYLNDASKLATPYERELLAFVNQLPFLHLQALLTILADCDSEVTMVQRDSQVDLLVLRQDENRSRDVRITLFNLKRAQQDLERKIQEWNDKVNDCSKAALQANRKGQTTQAIIEMKRRKLYETKVQSAYGKLFNLENQIDSIETAVDNSSIVSALEESNNVLKLLREDSVSIEKVDTIMEDIREERENLDSLNEAFASMDVTNDMDDDDLLQELKDLNLGDSPVQNTDDGDTAANEISAASEQTKPSTADNSDETVQETTSGHVVAA